jgi:hypothetical protein
MIALSTTLKSMELKPLKVMGEPMMLVIQNQELGTYSQRHRMPESRQ